MPVNRISLAAPPECPLWDGYNEDFIAVIVGLGFRHSKWELEENAGTRFRSITRELCSKGKLTRDPIKIKQWLTMRLTIQMASALMEEALTSDVKSWDVLFMRLLSWILQSAVDGKARDMAMTQYRQ